VRIRTQAEYADACRRVERLIRRAQAAIVVGIDEIRLTWNGQTVARTNKSDDLLLDLITLGEQLAEHSAATGLLYRRCGVA
jgi:hypothetical protein